MLLRPNPCKTRKKTHDNKKKLMQEGFLSNLVVFYYLSLIFQNFLFCFQFVIFGPLGFVISLFKLNSCSLRNNFYSFNIILESFFNFWWIPEPYFHKFVACKLISFLSRFSVCQPTFTYCIKSNTEGLYTNCLVEDSNTNIFNSNQIQIV